MNLAVIDIVFAIIMLLLVIRGMIRGFIAEIIAWASIVLGLLAGIFFYQNGAAFIRTKILQDIKVLPEIMAFAALFLIVFLALKILERIIKDIIEGIHLGGVDRFLGAVFGIVEGIAMAGLVLFILNIQPLFNPAPILRGSLFADLLLPLVPQGSLPAAMVRAAFCHV